MRWWSLSPGGAQIEDFIGSARSGFASYGGAYRDRTDDLLNANSVALPAELRPLEGNDDARKQVPVLRLASEPE